MGRRLLTSRPVIVETARAVPAATAVAYGHLAIARTADRGSRERDATALQRLAGNRAVAAAIAIGDDTATGQGTCSTPELTCTARAEREHSKNIQIGPPKKTRDRENNTIYKATGTVASRFKTNVLIDLATVPDGLSECASKKVATLIRTKLKPHEEDHKARFLTQNAKYSYVGPFSKSISDTSDDPATAQTNVHDQLEAALDVEVAKRIERNDDYAINAIDPFHVTTDISECPECSEE